MVSSKTVDLKFLPILIGIRKDWAIFLKDKIFGTRVDFFWNTPLFLRYEGVNATNAEKCVAKRR